MYKRQCAASSVNLKKDSACPVLAVERAILILHRRRPRRIAVRVHRKSGWNPERKRPLPFPAAAQRNGLFRCSFLHAAHSCLTRSAGTAHPANRKALFHQAQRRTLRKSRARTPIHASLHGQKNPSSARRQHPPGACVASLWGTHWDSPARWPLRAALRCITLSLIHI